MDKKRFFVPCKAGKDIVISGEEYNHIVNVMRLKTGDSIILCYNDGNDNHAQITEINKKSVTATVQQTLPNQAEPGVRLTLYQAAPKGDKLDLIVQKCSELGVERVVPFISRYTQVKRESVKTERLRRVALEAAKQCGRARLTEVCDAVTFEDILMDIATGGYDIILHPYENAVKPDLKSVLKGIDGGVKRIAVVIGSEGGFEDSECVRLQSLGAKQLTLGKRILRTETAAITVSAIVMYEMGELGIKGI